MILPPLVFPGKLYHGKLQQYFSLPPWADVLKLLIVVYERTTCQFQIKFGTEYYFQNITTIYIITFIANNFASIKAIENT